tara:strand:- start:4350 stop:5126 length:777 start_codon:yes stop_codon:yes gene_type:complete
MEIFAHILFDQTQRSINIKSSLAKKIKNYPISEANLLIVIGGDGFMLSCLKKYYHYKKPFYGINSGSYGFLMNKYIKEKTHKNIKIAKPVYINPLKMDVTKKNKKIKKSIAINEVSILRQSRQAAYISVSNKDKKIIKKLICDGLLVSTPAGSTAYNLSVHGPILNLDSKKIAISPISPFRPRRWKGKIVSDKSKITVKNLNVKKRPISAVADNHEVRNVKSIKIEVDEKIIFKLMYDKYNSLQKKIKIEQLRKETKS